MCILREDPAVPPVVHGPQRHPQALINKTKDKLKLLGIRKMKTSPYHPAANGLVERFNSTLKAMLAMFSKDYPK